VATARQLPLLREADVELYALVHSASDPSETYAHGDLPTAPRLVVSTEGAAGGRFPERSGRAGRYEATPLPGDRADTYGCGDSFAAGLAYALAAGLDVDAALALAARSGAAALCRPGAHGGAAMRTHAR
jgi:ribokinase